MIGTVLLEKAHAGLVFTNDGTKTTIQGITGDYIRIGDAATTSHSLASEDDLMVSGKLEVDGAAYFDSTIDTGGKLTAGANEIEGSNFDINGGTIDGVTITSPALSGTTTGTFTIGGTVTINAFTLGGTLDANGQNLDNVAIIYGNSTYLRIGDADTTQIPLSSEDDLMVTGNFEGLANAYLVSGGTGAVYINDTANAGVTVGLTINQGANTDDVLGFKNSGVAHGMTDKAETDTMGFVRPANAAYGGLGIWGLGENVRGMHLQALYTNDNTTKTTGGEAPLMMYIRKKSGSGVGNPGADANLLVITSGTTGRFIFDAEGSGHADVEWVAYDKHDDMALVQDMESELLLREDEAQTSRRHALESTGVIGKDSWHMEGDSPRAMVNFTKLSMLHHGALLQLHERCQQLEAQVKLLTA